MEALEVVKPRKVVEVSNTISLVQRKAFNCLIMQSMLIPKSKGQKYHRISIQELCHLTGYKQKDFLYLDEQLREMQTTLIEWSDSTKKGRVQFLGHVEYYKDSGMLEYSFSEKLIELIRQKKLFNRLDVGSMRELTSKYSIALYEFCTAFRETPTFKEGTGWRVLSDMKLLLCGDSKVYPQFKDFNKWVLRPSIKEVNEKTDIHVEMKTRKKGRSIYSVRFAVKGNESYKDILLEKPKGETTSRLEITNAPNVEQVPNEKLLEDMQLSGEAFRKVWEENGLKSSKKEDDLSNMPTWLKETLKKRGITLEEYEAEQMEQMHHQEKILAKQIEKIEKETREMEAYQAAQEKKAEEYLDNYAKKYHNCVPRFDDLNNLRPYNVIEKRFLKDSEI